MEFDVLIIGGGVSGMSAALLFGSAQHKPFMADKKIGIIVHQKTSSLQTAVFNKAYGITPGKKGKELLEESKIHLEKLYPHIDQIENEKVLEITGEKDNFTVRTNKNHYLTKNVIVGIGAGNPFTIAGLDEFVMPHQKATPEKNRLQLKNEDYVVKPGIYVVGTLAGLRSQLVIAAGSGAAVATDIMTLWNENKPVQVHDALPKE
jgi:thioredoxin reductase